MNRRHLVVHQCAFENDEGVRGGANSGLPPADPRLKGGMAQAMRRLSGLDDGEQQGEMPAAIEVVVVMPADVVAGLRPPLRPPTRERPSTRREFRA